MISLGRGTSIISGGGGAVTSGVVTSTLGAGRGAFDLTLGAGFLAFLVALAFFVTFDFFGAALRFLGAGFFLAIVTSSFCLCPMVDEIRGYWGEALSICFY
jgi:hypothetical protein